MVRVRFLPLEEADRTLALPPGTMTGWVEGGAVRRTWFVHRGNIVQCVPFEEAVALVDRRRVAWIATTLAESAATLSSADSLCSE